MMYSFKPVNMFSKVFRKIRFPHYLEVTVCVSTNDFDLYTDTTNKSCCTVHII